MTELFGVTRSAMKERYALLAPQGFVASRLPGWENALCQVVISPAMGARFTQILITFERDGHGHGNSGKTEFFGYVLEGHASVTLDAKRHRLDAGGFVYIPPNKDIHFQGSHSRILLVQKKYEATPGVPAPVVLTGQQREVKGHPFLGNEDARLQTLLPESPAFDLAVNIFTYQPGATLPFVETHIMEHGLLMLAGQGVYRLDADYHPVQAGDVIWMAPYCPQWFVAMGKSPASYIYYKDVNRDPM